MPFQDGPSNGVIAGPAMTCTPAQASPCRDRSHFHSTRSHSRAQSDYGFDPQHTQYAHEKASEVASTHMESACEGLSMPGEGLSMHRAPNNLPSRLTRNHTQIMRGKGGRRPVCIGAFPRPRIPGELRRGLESPRDGTSGEGAKTTVENLQGAGLWR
jgi:hypothetical protein